MPNGLNAQQIRMIAAQAWMTERTVHRFLRGEKSRPSCIERIKKAMRELGIDEALLIKDGTQQEGV
jgi:predicted transcriptional regulator